MKSHVSSSVIGYKPSAPRFLSFGCSLGIESIPQGLSVHEREVGLGAHPVGIDIEQIKTTT